MTLSHALELISSKNLLPGDEARSIMLPEYRRKEILHQPSELASWREAAVLVLLYEENDQACFPLILRVDGPGVHANQVSLPGGAREPGEDLQNCAIRETAEETGVCHDDIRIIRELSPLQVPPSRFTVQPYVGMLAQRPIFRPAPEEVAAIVVPTIDEMLDPGNRAQEILSIRGHDWLVPYYRLGGHRVWGATAMILAELSAMIGRPGALQQTVQVP